MTFSTPTIEECLWDARLYGWGMLSICYAGCEAVALNHILLAMSCAPKEWVNILSRSWIEW